MTPTPKWQQQHPHIWRATQLQQQRIDFDLCSFGHHCKGGTRLLALKWPALTDTIQQRPNCSKCTCNRHDFDPQHPQLTIGTFYLPRLLTDLIVSTLQIAPRRQSTAITDTVDYAAYLPLDPYHFDHIAPTCFPSPKPHHLHLAANIIPHTSALHYSYRRPHRPGAPIHPAFLNYPDQLHRTAIPT